MSTDACCICTQLFDHSDTKTEKPLRLSHRLACCNRLICDRCTSSNPRYTSYCPYCQISFQPPSEKLLPDGLRDPPPYTPAAAPSPLQKDQPPPYEAEAREDVVHFLSPGETLQSLSLAYGIPIEALRRANGVFADTLVAGRRSVVVPGAGRSLAPEPADPEGEEKRLALRRFMVATKMADYDVAGLYLKHADYDLDEAIKAFREDEEWERAHPMQSGKGKTPAKAVGMRRFVGKAASSSQR